MTERHTLALVRKFATRKIVLLEDKGPRIEAKVKEKARAVRKLLRTGFE